MTSVEDGSAWEKCDSPDTNFVKSSVINIDDKLWYCTESEYARSPGMIEYDITKDTFEIIKYPAGIRPISQYCCYCDGIIYLIDHRRGEIMTFDPSTKTFGDTKYPMPKAGGYSVCIAVDKCIHIFVTQTHLIFDTTLKKVVKKKKCEIVTGNGGECILRYSDKILKFGGWNGGKPVDKFYIISNVNKDEDITWKEMDEYKLIKPMESCGYIMYKHYAITIGGHDGNYLDGVYLLSLNANSKESSGKHQDGGWKKIEHIKAPASKAFHAVLTRDNYVHLLSKGFDALIHYKVHISKIIGNLYGFLEVHGYVRLVEKEMAPMVVPQGINDIICSFYV